MSAKRRQRFARIRAAQTLFIHVPKNAGMSVSQALYGQQVGHASARYYTKVAPDLFYTMPSFAVVRDPVARFLSAYRYARAGGSGDNRVATAFRAQYVAFQSVDDALDQVEAAETVFQMDHIFRRQGWYVTDSAGRVTVDHIVAIYHIGRIEALGADGAAVTLPHMIRLFGRIAMSPEQVGRLERLYPQDFELVAGAEASQRPLPRLAEDGVALRVG